MNIFKELLDAFNFKLWIQKKQEAKRAQDILKLIRSREQERQKLSPTERQKQGAERLKKLLKELKDEEDNKC